MLGWVGRSEVSMGGTRDTLWADLMSQGGPADCPESSWVGTPEARPGFI